MGQWGGGWGSHTSQSAKDVAAAFFAGKTKKRSSCRTDGNSYVFLASDGREVKIARRVSEDRQLDEITRAIMGEPYQRPLEFQIYGYRTPTTARHLNALGLDVQCHGIKSPQFWVNGKLMPDDHFGWFTANDTKSWWTEHPDDQAKRERLELRARNRAMRQSSDFVQLTAPLPF